MPESKKNIVCWISIAVCLFLFAAAKFLYPAQIRSAFEHSQFESLNALTGSKENQPLDFYLGTLEENVYGPLAYLFAGLALLIFGSRYLVSARGFFFTITIFIFLLVVKWEVLQFPPYGDTVSGPLVEAHWLADNNFDYYNLWQQPGFHRGGPKVYLFTIYTTIQGLMIKYLPTAKLYLVVNHLLTFLLGALSVTAVWKMAQKIFTPKIAFFVAMVFFSFPITQSMIEAINMEVPKACAAVWAIYFLVDKKFLLASLFGILTAIIKGTGILIPGAVLVVSGFMYFWGTEKERFKKKPLLAAIICALFLAGFLYLNLKVLNNDGRVAMVGMFRGWDENKKLLVWPLYAASFVVFLGNYFRERFKTKALSFRQYLNDHYGIAVVFITVVAYIALYIHSFGAQHRYRLLLAPFTLMCIFYAFQVFVRSEKVQKWFLIATAAFSFFCAYGYLYPDYEVTSHSTFERSLEYRNDLRTQMKVARALEENFSDFTIGAPFTIVQALAFPKFGFVDKKLDVMIYSYPCTYGGIKNFKGLQDLNIMKTIWVGFPLYWPLAKQLVEYYPYGPEDRVISTVSYGNRHATLFMGGIYIHRLYIAEQMFYRQYLLKKNQEEKAK